MTRMERRDARQRIKDRLHQYTQLQREKHQIQEELARISLETASVSSPNMDGMPRGSGISKPTEAGAFARINIMERYQAQLDKLAEEQLALEKLIEKLDPVERRLLRYRYLDGLTWESVCVAMNYSWRQTHNIHARALDKLAEQEQQRG